MTVSTRVKNWMHALRVDLADGYLARYEDGAFRIVADGFRFTNEIRFDAREEFLYVVETTGGCITRLRIDEGWQRRRTRDFGPTSLGKGAWPDGIAFDSYGNLWGALVYSDKLFVLTPKGDLRVLLDEGDPAKVAALERAFFSNQVTEDVLFSNRPGRCALDGKRDLRRARSPDGLHRFLEGEPHTLLPRARAGPSDGPLERRASRRTRGMTERWPKPLYFPAQPPSTWIDCPVR